jgi:hypothetical protein
LHQSKKAKTRTRSGLGNLFLHPIEDTVLATHKPPADELFPSFSLSFSVLFLSETASKNAPRDRDEEKENDKEER